MVTGNSSAVLIVGAGPVGLIAAHELARRGIPIRLVDKRQGPSHTSRAFTLHARTMEMFEHIGIAHRLEEVCLMCPGNIYHFAGLPDEDKPRTDFRTLDSRYSFYYKLNQNDFEQVLREHLLAGYGVVPEYGSEVVGLVNYVDHVDVTISHAGAAGPEVTRHPWVIGSDGAHSVVRDLVEIPFPGERVGVMAMMDVELEDVDFDDSWVNYFIGENVFMLVTKLPGAFWRVYLSDAGAMTKTDSPRESFQAVADDLGIGIRIGEPQWATQWDILNNVALAYRQGRVLICGDASHVHSPAGGQGMNGCMQDAFNLGWKLAAVVNGTAPEAILDTYEAERKPIGAQITAGAKSTHDIVMAFGKGIDDRIALTRQPEWQQGTVELISGVSHNYRSTVTVPAGLTPVPGPQAGERAPDAELCAQPHKRVFDLLRHCGFTMLLVSDMSHDQIEQAAEVADMIENSFGSGVKSILISNQPVPEFDFDHWAADRAGNVARAYSIEPGEGRAILIRPDMYVGVSCRLDEATHTLEYLSQWYTPLPTRVPATV